MFNSTDRSLPTEAQTTMSESGPLVLGAVACASSMDSPIALFEQMSRSHAEKVAVVSGPDQVTYAELNRAANRVAHRLIGMGLAPGALVAIYLDRSIGMLSAMLGILKARCSYLPIDPTYPVARVVQTLEDARPGMLISDRRLVAGLPPVASRLFFLNDSQSASEERDPAGRSSPDDVAYVMYTSGSTGKPKGVQVTNRNLLRLFTATQPWFHFDEHDVWTMFHSFAFDFSVWEIWGPLVTGGKLVIVPFAVSRSPEDFYALLAEEKVTVLNQTPSAFLLLSRIEEMGKALPLALRVVVFGGEALRFRALLPWFQRHGEARPQLVNMYGITETTVHVTYRVVREQDAETELESLIGVPIPDMQIHLLDPEGRPVADGEVGEIYVGGGGVARGYLNRPELTAERFVADPWSSGGARLYRSGDLARRRPDGELAYLGRGDSQVKINGFRIELGEVEAAIADYPGVRQLCVAAHIDAGGSQRLAAYYVVAEGAAVQGHMLSEFLSKRLPAQMMPAFYMQVEAIPLTGNGKVDRAALPVPAAGSKATGSGAGTPVQEQVAAVWRRVLDAPEIGFDDNFFDIGGSSLLLITARAELQERLGRAIPITWMFEFTTVRALAGKLGEGAETVGAGKAPLGAAQQQAQKQREAFARLRAAKGVSR